MTNDERIAWLTSAKDEAAVNLLSDVLSAGIPLDVVICATSKNNSRFESVRNLCSEYNLSCIHFPNIGSETDNSALKDIEDLGLKKKCESEFKRWEYDRELVKLLEKSECRLVVLAGFMRIVTPVLWTDGRIILNLHPAPPLGPAGMWEEVMWTLIAVRARQAGGMLHITTKKPDRGPVVSYYTVPLDDDNFKPLWDSFAEKLKTKSLHGIKEDEGEDEPLFAAIRKRQFAREAPLLISTLKKLMSGDIQVDGNGVKVNGIHLPDGLCMNDEVENMT